MSDKTAMPLPQNYYTPMSSLVTPNHPCLCCEPGKYHSGRYMTGLALPNVVGVAGIDGNGAVAGTVPAALMLADMGMNRVQLISSVFVSEDAFKAMVMILNSIVHFLNHGG